MDKKSKNTLIVSIIALALVLIGVTYAYFSARITGLESASTLSLTAGRMGIVYSEGDENININGIYPRSEEWLTKTFTLTGYNTTDQPMRYEVGIQIFENTFKGGQLTYSLTLNNSENGHPMENVTSKALVGTNRIQRIGYGDFLLSGGETQTYTLKIFFKENGIDQNFNQGAEFRGKIVVTDRGTIIAYNPCTDEEHLTLSQGDEYVNGQYTYRYMQEVYGTNWRNISEDGWGMYLTDHRDTSPVTTEMCTEINGKPIVSMSEIFEESLASSIDLSSFDTSKVTNMLDAFFSLAVTNLDVSSFDTSNTTNMRELFLNCEYLQSLDVSNFDTSNVTDMDDTFSGLRSITSIDLSSLNTSNVTTMVYMFGWSAFPTIDLSTFDTRKVTNMDSMFRSSEFTMLDLSTFDTSNVTNMGWMFGGNSNLTTIYTSDKFVTTSLAQDSSSYPNYGSYRMFYGATSLVGGAGTTYNSSKTNKEYAHIDGGVSNPGYFTLKNN